MRRGGAIERTLLEGQIGVKVGTSRIGRFVTQPQGDSGGVETCGEHPHCAGVAKNVGRDVPVDQAGTRGGGRGAVELDPLCDGVGRHPSPRAPSDEYGINVQPNILGSPA
jgi:hypothetical protein